LAAAVIGRQSLAYRRRPGPAIGWPSWRLTAATAKASQFIWLAAAANQLNGGYYVNAISISNLSAANGGVMKSNGLSSKAAA